MDVLSDVLRVVRLSASVFFTTEFTAPWSISSPSSGELAPAFMPGVEGVSLFHVLATGRAWVGYDGIEPIELSEGDVVVFPRAQQHFMGSAADAVPTPITRIIQLTPSLDIPHIHHGGGGEAATFVCGFLHCDQLFNLLMDTLPEMIHIRRSGCDRWLDSTLQRMVEEAVSGRSGSRAMLSRMAELMFVQVLREHMEHLEQREVGWLAGLRDPSVGRALQHLHAEPARGWTVEELSRQIGMSRSTLADRFAGLIGEAPMTYLTRWRMQLAKFLLMEEKLTVTDIASRVGYESEAAFSRAFKRTVGAPPATWRRKRSAAH